MINPPTKKPNASNPPWDEKQMDPGPIVDAPVFPQIGMNGTEIKGKAKPGPMNSRILRVGRKLGSKQGEK